MNLLDLGKKLAGFGLDALGTAVGGPLGGMVTGWIGHKLGLGTGASAADIGQAMDANPANAKVQLQELENEKAEDLARINEAQTQITQTNQTLRSYLASSDAFVRRAPAFFFYIAAVSFGMTILCIVGGMAGAVWASVSGHGEVVKALSDGVSGLVTATIAIWSVALPILGVVRVKDSHDKQVAAGQEPASLIGAIAKRIQGAASGG